MKQNIYVAEDEVFKIAVYNGETFPNYEVSNKGRVYSINKDKILPERVSKDGRVYYRLWKNGKEKHVLGHRLVASTFLTNENNCRAINHKNENPSDNNIDNLEYCTDKYNLNYGTAQKRRALKRSKAVIQLDEDKFFVALYVSMNEAARQTGISIGRIYKGCRTGNFQKGYYWSYANGGVNNI